MVYREHPSWGRGYLPDQLLCSDGGKLSLPGWKGRGGLDWGEENRRCYSDSPYPPARWANGYSEEKPLCVPRDAPFQLETCPLTAVDALGNSLWVRSSPPLAHTLAGWGGGGRP